MRKLLIALMLAVLALQAHAYIYEGSYWSTSSTVKSPTLVLSRPGTTAKALIVTDWRRIDVNGLERHINEVLADNRSGCQALASYFGRASYCRTYIDFPLSRYGVYGTLRVYSGIERVSVSVIVDRSGVYWLRFTAQGSIAKPTTNSARKTLYGRVSYKRISAVSGTLALRKHHYYRTWSSRVRSYYYNMHRHYSRRIVR